MLTQGWSVNHSSCCLRKSWKYFYQTVSTVTRPRADITWRILFCLWFAWSILRISSSHQAGQPGAGRQDHWLTDWVKVIPAVRSQYNWLLQPQASRRAQSPEKKLFFAGEETSKKVQAKILSKKGLPWLQWAMRDSCSVRPDLIFSPHSTSHAISYCFDLPVTGVAAGQ